MLFCWETINLKNYIKQKTELITDDITKLQGISIQLLLQNRFFSPMFFIALYSFKERVNEFLK